MTLEQYLAREDMTDAEFGTKVSLSQSQISRIRRGISLPSWDAMDRIETATGGEVCPGDFRRTKAEASA